jgi:hypothetical protein
MWTTEIPLSSVDVNLGAEEATLHLKNVLVFDTFTTGNSLDPHHVMGLATHVVDKLHAVINSLRITWSNTVMRRSHTDCIDAFRGDYLEDTATIEVTATTFPMPAKACPPGPGNNGFRFVSNGSVSNFAQIGRERNGVFYTQG